MTKPTSWYAERYVERFGMHLVPIEPRRKFPTATDWGRHVITTPGDARSYYEDRADWNVGLALGPSGFCSLDIDCEKSMQIILSEMGIDPSELDKFPSIQGRDKGRRLLFKVPEGGDLPYVKLNWPTESGDKQYTVMELRAATDGKQRQDVLPPSIHPDTGRPYKWLVQPQDDWPEPPNWLLVIWREWDKFKPQLKSICPWSVEPETPQRQEKPRNDRDSPGGNVIAEYISRNPLDAELRRHGYRKVGKRYLSPHTTTKLPGVVLFPDGQSCFIHHASDPLCSEETGRPVNAFDLFCEYEHNGDVSKAVKALAEEYGMRRERKTTPEAAAINPPAPDDDMPPPEIHEEAGVDSAPATTAPPFRALGFDGAVYYYLPRGTEQVCEIRRGSHTSPAEMLALAPVEWWDMAYPKEKGGCDWQAAASSCMRACEAMGVYSLKNVRGRGAWYDGGSSVLHLGDKLIVDGKPQRIIDHSTRYIYTRQAPMESTIDEDPATDAEAMQVSSLFRQLNWAQPVHGWMAAGWTVLAPICGALAWRPHIWLTAQRGAGKSWMQENIIAPLLGQSAMVVQGGTTEAGIRQHLKQDARPVIFDEAEAENQRGQQRMQSVIELARQSSSDGSAEIVKGTATGGGMSFRMRSMFMLGSVNVSLTQAADESRFTVISLNQPTKSKEEIERFNKFSVDVGNTLTPARCAAIRARTYHMIPIIRENAKTMAQAVAEELGSQRIGDQIGTLLAGAISLSRSDLVSLEDARAWAGKINLDDARESQEVSDEEMCLNAIMQTQIQFDASGRRYQRTISEVVMAAGGKKVLADDVYADECNAVLARHGLLVESGTLLVSNTHAELKRMLRETPWAAGWRRVLGRMEGATASANAVRFAGSKTRAVCIPLDSFL